MTAKPFTGTPILTDANGNASFEYFNAGSPGYLPGGSRRDRL